MSTFVEECRREWKRLGVPDSIAEEMASELTADLAEASADGVSEAEMLGESDPRRFAASWASARGLALEEPPPPRRRRYLWWILATVIVLFVGLAVAGALFVATGVVTATVSTSSGGAPLPQRRLVSVPFLVGMKERRALSILAARHLRVHVVSASHGPVAQLPPRRGTVKAQAPSGGAHVPRGSTVLLRVGTGG